jgi:hypothetical protein
VIIFETCSVLYITPRPALLVSIGYRSISIPLIFTVLILYYISLVIKELL